MEKVVVVGAGYVGLANAFLLGITEDVTLIDINEEKINMLKSGVAPINDEYINKYIDKVNVKYNTRGATYYNDADMIIIATNTDYNEEKHYFNLNSIEAVVESIDNNTETGKVIVLKSTIPIGYTQDLQNRYPRHKFIFSPEFLRESFALYDNLYPDRIVVGNNFAESEKVAELLRKNVKIDGVPVMLIPNKEAEMVKLFANTYLATRVAYVNEIDSFCQKLGVNSADVITAVGLDHRIGTGYFNPSFGFGGYCLPKDTKQLREEFINNGVASAIIANVPDANEKRKSFITEEIIKKVSKATKIGMYRIVAKKGINNYRSSASVDIMLNLQALGYEIVVYEPNVEEKSIFGIEVENELEQFKAKVDFIVANRLEEEIKDMPGYSTDVFNEF